MLGNPVSAADPTGLLTANGSMSKYPNASAFIHRMKAYSPAEYSAFAKYGQASRSSVNAAFVSGKGPVINASALTNANGSFQPNAGSNVLNIDVGVLQSYESGLPGSQTLLESTVKHELTHFFDDQNGVDFPGEEGAAFEKAVYGKDVDTLKDGVSVENTCR